MKKQEILYSILNKISIFTIIMITFITTSSALFLPDKYLLKLKLLKYVNESGHIFGILFLISISSLLVIVGIKIYNYINKIKVINNLTPKEKYILIKYIYNETQTNYFSNVTEGILLGLKHKGILYNPKRFVDLLKEKEPINIKFWVWNYLKKHKELLELNSEETSFLNEKELRDLEKLECLKDENKIFKSS